MWTSRYDPSLKIDLFMETLGLSEDEEHPGPLVLRFPIIRMMKFPSSQSQIQMISLTFSRYLKLWQIGSRVPVKPQIQISKSNPAPLDLNKMKTWRTTSRGFLPLSTGE